MKSFRHSLVGLPYHATPAILRFEKIKLGTANLDYSLSDPKLTALGRQQCAELMDHLQHRLPLAERADAIICSPMRRTIETALLSLDPLTNRGVKIELDADWQENSEKPCDTGTSVTTLKQEFPNLDFSTVDPSYPDKTTRQPDGSGNPYAFERRTVEARGQRCLQKLYKRSEEVIFVVSHSAFLRLGVSGRRFANADYRVFDILKVDAGSEKEEYRLEEWETTSGSSGGMGNSLDGLWEVQPGDFPPEEAVEEANGAAPEEKDFKTVTEK